MFSQQGGEPEWPMGLAVLSLALPHAQQSVPGVNGPCCLPSGTPMALSQAISQFSLLIQQKISLYFFHLLLYLFIFV